MSRNRKPRHRSGFVAILGRPNAGKSTLLNALVETKVAIVSDKPQTTRTTIQGVVNRAHAQIVFVDTPGIHRADSLINRRMMDSIGEALDEPDVALYLHDATRSISEEDRLALAELARLKCPVFLVLTKSDLVKTKASLLPQIEQWRAERAFAEIFPLSAATGEGLAELEKAITKALPPGPPLYPEDYFTDQPERYLVSELIREKILLLTRQEVPHSVAVLIEEWQEQGRLTRIGAAVHVERPGQKAIILGAKGALLKRIGTEAREEIEEMLGRRVFLSLFVKVTPKWRENESFLKELDWRAMTGGDGNDSVSAPLTAEEVAAEEER